MKYLKKNLPLLLIAGILSFYACEKEKNDPYKPAPAISSGSNDNGPPPTYVSLRIKKNGKDTSWTAATFYYKTFYKDTDSAYGRIEATGGQALTIKIPLREGEHILGKSNANGKYWANYSEAGLSESGELKVSFVDKVKKTVSGNFNYKAGSVIIYEGRFVNIPEKE